MLIGQIAYVELLPRYRIINYKPWLSPHKSEVRLIDSTNNRIIFSQNYLPKLVPNQNSTDLHTTKISSPDEQTYEIAYQKIISFCNNYNIIIESNNPLLGW